MVMMKPEHIRPNMDEQKNDEQTAWVRQPDLVPVVAPIADDHDRGLSPMDGTERIANIMY